MNHNLKLTRKEVASLIEKLTGISVSVDQVRKNEKLWGISAARGQDLNRRTVRYCRDKVIKGLIAKGIVETGAIAPIS